MKKVKGLVDQAFFGVSMAIAVIVLGCGNGRDGGTSVPPGTLSVSLTDSPACGYDEVNVTVSKVRVHQSSSAQQNSSGWSEIALNPPIKINLLDYNDPTQDNFALLTLGETTLPAGHYTQLRLVLVANNGSSPPANSVVLSGTSTEIALETPSALQSGIKLVHEFNVPSGQRVDLVLDFDACQSIVQTGSGKYKLKPVIKVIPYVLNGIEGFVDPNLLGSHVVVSAQLNGEIVRATVPNSNAAPDPKRGKFFLARLTSGMNYDVVITADGHATAVIAGVPVPTDISITPISTDAAPFTLQASVTQAINGTVTLNPPDDDGTVVVAANQSISGGPTVIVNSVVANVLDNALPVGDYGYAMTLPTGAPAFAAYGSLPITPSSAAQGGVAGIYTINGSGLVGTTVYATQNPAPSPKDITVPANQTQDFTLTP